jgi:hypothetical protein
MKQLIGMLAMIVVLGLTGLKTVCLVVAHADPKLAADINIRFLLCLDVVWLFAFFYLAYFALRALMPYATGAKTK